MLGVSHEEVMRWQKQAQKKCQKDPSHISIGIFEYCERVVTGGFRAQMSASDRQRLRHLGIRIMNVNRGGGWTIHHPGQIVVFPVMNTHHKNGLTVKGLTILYADVIFRLCASLGVAVFYNPNDPGLWFAGGDIPEKIGQIGFSCRNHITGQGFSINVLNDISEFQYFKACSGQGKATSLKHKCQLKQDDLFDIVLSGLVGELCRCFCQKSMS